MNFDCFLINWAENRAANKTESFEFPQLVLCWLTYRHRPPAPGFSSWIRTPHFVPSDAGSRVNLISVISEYSGSVSQSD